MKDDCAESERKLGDVDLKLGPEDKQQKNRRQAETREEIRHEDWWPLVRLAEHMLKINGTIFVIIPFRGTFFISMKYKNYQ